MIHYDIHIYYDRTNNPLHLPHLPDFPVQMSRFYVLFTPNVDLPIKGVRETEACEDF